MIEAATDIRLQCGPHILIDNLQVEPFRIKIPTAPTPSRDMFRMLRSGDDLEEVLISLHTTHIFRRPGARARETRCLPWHLLECEKLLDFQRVPPVISEIIDIGENCLRVVEIFEMEIVNIEYLPVVLDASILPHLEIAIPFLADPKFVEMIIPPIERCLNGQMEIFKIPVQRHDKPSPDQRADLIDRDSDLNRI